MKLSVQIARNILSNWGSISIGVIIQFLMMPFLIHRLGDTHYGIWVLIISFTGFLGLFDLGVGGSVLKYVAEYRAKGDNEGLNGICSTAFYIFLASGVAVFLVSLALTGFVQSFRIPREEIATARWVTLIIGSEIALSLPTAFFTGYMRGMQRYDHVAAIRLALFCVRSLAIFILVLAGFRLVAMALVLLITTAVSGAIRAIYVYHANPGLRLQIGLISRDKFTVVFRYSALIFLYYVAMRLVFSSGSLVIGYYLATAAITFYAIPQRLVNELRTVIMSTGVMQPTVSHLDARGEKARVRNLLVKATKYTMMVALPVVVSYVMVGDVFISLWMGPRYGAACYAVLVILSCAVAANLTQYTSRQVLQGIARHGSVAYITVCEAAANLVLSIFLAKRYGIVGVAVGTLVPMFCANLLVIPWYTCRGIGLPMSRFFGEGLLLPLVPALFLGILLYTASRMTKIDSWVELISVLAVCLSLYVLSAWRLCLSRQERVKRWKELSATIRSASVVIRSLVLSVRSRPERLAP